MHEPAGTCAIVGDILCLSGVRWRNSTIQVQEADKTAG
jgi:hypothetical protein